MGAESEQWSNGPGTVYPVHDHRGSITFHLPRERRTAELHLPPNSCGISLVKGHP